MTDKMTKYLGAVPVLLCFLTAAICLHIQQWLGLPLRWINATWAKSWQNYIKASTAILMIGLNQWRAPITAHISGDASVAGQIRKDKNGNVICEFPKRMVLVANHQIYTDWLALWWTAYTTSAHGHFHVVLKDGIRRIPIIGHGLVFFSWIFLSRRWETDQRLLQESLSNLSDYPGSKHQNQTPTAMWLLIFPEGTNLSKRSSAISKKWAESRGIRSPTLTLLPRARGLQACIAGLAGSVDWLYDCTIAYENLPLNKDSQDIYNLRTLYLDGLAAPQTHIYWRRFHLSSIPWQDFETFEQWLIDRWTEKEDLLRHFNQTGSFPSAEGYVKTDIRLNSPVEFLQIGTSIFAMLAAWWIGKGLYGGLVGVYTLAVGR
ncbi:hypothetical protein LTR78_006013 [Recurvomyces mirabilis]|uniref:Phospholipid/glycerol acyltransferase domain-containing protein n=1 Tax=Recurvomyces mirabilis TaxID=574656 RepID=A0AAE0WM04_9PEZI|nr:hypothetical protein LTR78_006013 [Recurvomyces mirabilis]KAK5155177.1 hypothetical protein LTS14_006132 [Recurvomyces mirabilis]